jgi:hypothetical protein
MVAILRGPECTLAVRARLKAEAPEPESGLWLEADGRTRTGDILFTREVLYQLSYGGEVRGRVGVLLHPSMGIGRV